VLTLKFAGMTTMLACSKLSKLGGLIADFVHRESPLERAIFTTSLSQEDQILTWAIVKAELPVDIVTLDTGKLFPETMALHALTEQILGVEIEKVHPQDDDVSGFEKEHGMEAIYLDVNARKRCCTVRKVLPLQKVCEGRSLWITGLRRGQSDNRSGLEMLEPAPDWGLKKLHPLLDWTDEEIRAALPVIDIPVNPLHAQGYPSVGCEPCTRAVAPGEHPRSGRWWWEQSSKECGLHKG